MNLFRQYPLHFQHHEGKLGEYAGDYDEAEHHGQDEVEKADACVEGRYPDRHSHEEKPDALSGEFEPAVGSKKIYQVNERSVKSP